MRLPLVPWRVHDLRLGGGASLDPGGFRQLQPATPVAVIQRQRVVLHAAPGGKALFLQGLVVIAEVLDQLHGLVGMGIAMWRGQGMRVPAAGRWGSTPLPWPGGRLWLCRAAVTRWPHPPAPEPRDSTFRKLKPVVSARPGVWLAAAARPPREGASACAPALAEAVRSIRQAPLQVLCLLGWRYRSWKSGVADRRR